MGAAWLFGAALAAATPQTGNASVDAFVADLAAGRRSAALMRIEEMNSLSGQPNAVALAGEFVDKLMRCTLLSWEPRAYGPGMFDLRWRCPDGEYFSMLDASYRPPRLVVAEFLSAATREARRRNRSVSAPMPSRAGPPPLLSDEEKIGIVTAYLDGIQPGGSAIRAYINFRLHFMDRREGDSFISPGQLGEFLVPCRRAGTRVPQSGPYSGGVIVRWTCTGRGALATELTTIIYPQDGRVTGGGVLVGPVPDLAP